MRNLQGMPRAASRAGTQTNASVSSAAAMVQQDADVASVSSSFCHHCTLPETISQARKGRPCFAQQYHTLAQALLDSCIAGVRAGKLKE